QVGTELYSGKFGVTHYSAFPEEKLEGAQFGKLHVVKYRDILIIIIQVYIRYRPEHFEGMRNIFEVFVQPESNIIDHVTRENEIVAAYLEYLVDRNAKRIAKDLNFIQA